MCYFIVINFFYTHFHFHHSSFLSSLFFPLHYLSFIPHLRASVFLPLLCTLLSSSSSHSSFILRRHPLAIFDVHRLYGKLVQFITRPIYLLSYFIYFDSSVAKMCTIHSFHISAFNRYSTFICSLISFVVHSFLFALFSCCHYIVFVVGMNMWHGMLLIFFIIATLRSRLISFVFDIRLSPRFLVAMHAVCALFIYHMIARAACSCPSSYFDALDSRFTSLHSSSCLSYHGPMESSVPIL